MFTTQACTQAIRYQCFYLAECSVSITSTALLPDQHACSSVHHYHLKAEGFRTAMQIQYTSINPHYEYASAVMTGLIFLDVKQRDAIKHALSIRNGYKSHFL